MINTIKKKILYSKYILPLIFAPLFLLATTAFVQTGIPGLSGSTQAAEPTANIQGNLCGGATDLKFNPTQKDCSSAPDETQFNNLLAKIINIISVIVGVVAVIMIIIGGFRYITSGGSPEKVSGAKNTILYGIIGLIIVALAQVVVRFVLKQVTT
jgi:hypothetical protein